MKKLLTISFLLFIFFKTVAQNQTVNGNLTVTGTSNFTGLINANSGFFDGWITYSQAQINRNNGYVELQYNPDNLNEGVKIFGLKSYATIWNGLTGEMNVGGLLKANVGLSVKGNSLFNDELGMSKILHSNKYLFTVENDGYLEGTTAGIEFTSKNTAGNTLSRIIENYQGKLRFLDIDGSTVFYENEQSTGNHDFKNGTANFGGLLSVNKGINVSTGVFNSSVATFTGANTSRGLEISTFQRGSNDDSVDFNAPFSGGIQTFSLAGVEKMRVDAAGVDITGTLGVTGISKFNGTTPISLNSTITNGSTGINFSDNGVNKWRLYKETNNRLYIHNIANGTFPFQLNSNNDFYLRGRTFIEDDLHVNSTLLNLGSSSNTNQVRMTLQKDVNNSSGWYMGYLATNTNNLGFYGYENASFQIYTNNNLAFSIDALQNTIFKGSSGNNKLTINPNSSNQQIIASGGLNLGAGTGNVRVSNFGTNSELLVDDTNQITKVKIKAIGTSEFLGGGIQIPNNSAIYAPNSTGSETSQLLATSGSNQLILGQAARWNGLGVYSGAADYTMYMDNAGNVGVGTTTTGSHKLAVEGSIGAREIKVTAEGTPWSDFVFYKDYNLPTLEEVEKHIKEKGHLKDIPSAKEVEKNGIFLGEMNAKLLQKIEELTLYTIQQQKEIEKLKKEKIELQELKDKFAELEKLIKNEKKQ
ncbi:hypothetical protein [Polaribacter porphyrae]|uniref:Peptidase S74 domain-containing protein n=1 Tax=Polaribacter porphyrae TaxID=1137780 RepID=A0A2S7WSK8_9FLAO|nr:hypothetical protein [Polaribacter porphyrae]PQJ80301.1 hypothetical protein BTO18_14440 [Polaribacter porphyrae]